MTPATASSVLTDPSPSDADAPVESFPTGDLLTDDDGWLSPEDRAAIAAYEAERDADPAQLERERVWDEFVEEVEHRDWRSMLFADEPVATARDIAAHVANHGGAVAR